MASASVPPPFQEAARCDVCSCSFSTFKRRHHCRCCGRTLCSEHSSQQMALPQFGIYSAVRVCADCANDTSSSGKDGSRPGPKVASDILHVTDSVAKLDIEEADHKSELPAEACVANTIECKCGMPLCICQAPTPPPKAASLIERKSTSLVVAQVNKPKRAGSSRDKDADSSSKFGSSSNLGQATGGNQDTAHADYEVNGEGAREAIKNSDAIGIKKLLSQGVDANYRDKQGFSLLHLAAVFNQTEIAFILIDNGASLDCKNAQGETPLDCAPTTLQYKIRDKIKDAKLH